MASGGEKKKKVSTVSPFIKGFAGDPQGLKTRSLLFKAFILTMMS
jgi:hypothetical protein